MKTIIQSTLAVFVFGSFFFFASPAFAQYDGWTDYGTDYGQVNTDVFYNPSTDYVSTGCVGCDTGPYVNDNYSGWTNYGTDNNQVNTGTFYNPSTDYVSTGCVGCNSSNNYNSDYYYSGGCVGCNTTSNDYYSSGCVGCNSTYETPSYTYTPGYTYTSPSYTSDYTYTSPSSWTGYDYSSYNYTTPTYTYTTPTYTTYNYTNPTYTNTVLCSDGSLPVNGTCNNVTTIPVTHTTVCADGLPRNADGSCTRTTTVPVTTTTVCADGLPRNTDGSCTRTNTIPTTTNTVCSDGLPPVNGSCVRTNTIPTTVQTICSDGSYPVNGSCTHVITTPSVTYQTCWDGSTIPLYSVCPAQYKTCSNGVSIPINQTCYYGNPVPYVPPVRVAFNNVITSVTTEITNTSARCNGIGLIANGSPSVGWFEYGETANLGRETAHANIGSAPTSPFSNKLVNLKPSTTYFCRAVMQNQYGVVKGEIVKFTTRSTAVSYVKPVTKTTVKSTITKTVAKKNQVVCTDGSVVSVGSSAADLINSGSKLVSLQIEKVSGDLSVGSNIVYRLTASNLSDSALKDMTIKITIPQDVQLTNASAGSYDPTMHVLTVTGVPLNASGNAVINWTGTIAPSATVGASEVTTAYASYTVPGSQAQDEVSAYVVNTIVPSAAQASTTGSKTVIGAGAGSFLPNSLIEWLALIAILFIIFILGRSVYVSYKSEKEAH